VARGRERPASASRRSPSGNGRWWSRSRRGLSNAEIGKQLLSEASVKARVSRALAKLGLTNRVQAAVLAHDAGLLR
jgi:DNA-binding CsgD family transcriptional regulator